MSDKVLTGMLVGLVAGVAGILGVLVLALLMPRKKCPKCGAALSKFRNSWAPGVFRTCGNCGCGVSASGQRVKGRRERTDGGVRRQHAAKETKEHEFEVVEDEHFQAASPRFRPQRGIEEDEREYEDVHSPRRRSVPHASNAAAYWIIGGVCGGVLLLLLIVLAIVVSMDEVAPPPPPVVVGVGGGPVPVHVNPVPPVPQDLGPKEAQTLILGGAFDPTFKDEAPAKGMLTGFDVGLGKFLNLDVVKAVQPRYRTQHGEVAGGKYGLDFSHKVSVHAKPGYAVGAINVKAGLLVNGFSVTFMRIKGDVLDPMDAYTSAWIGDKTGGNGPTVLGGEGKPIVGVIGKRNERDCNGLGLLKKR